jgi:hypothetical protein
VDGKTFARAPLDVHRVLSGAAADQTGRSASYAGRHLPVVSIFERSLTTSVNNSEHIESQSINGVAVIEVLPRTTANIDGAISGASSTAALGRSVSRPSILCDFNFYSWAARQVASL